MPGATLSPIVAQAAPFAGSDWFWPSLALGALLLVLIATWAALRALRDIGRSGHALVRTAGDSAVRAAETLAGAFRTSLNLDPRIRIDGVTLHEGITPARELVMVRQVLTRTHGWSNTQLWSTKKVTLTATFSVRAGFDLSRPIEIDLTPDGSRAEVRWPAPRVLAVQIEHLEPATEEAGWWNRITPADRAAVQLEMQRLVEQDAAESGLLARAEAELRQLLHEQTRPAGSGLHLRFEPPAPAPQPGPTPTALP